MKRRNKRWIYLAVTLTVIYIILLVILYLAESGNPQASIKTFPDAFWYSLVTLTTVGYGDLIPVTPAGHAVGSVFLILATGIMVTLFGTVVSVIASEGLPFMMLKFQRRKNWYYFADFGPEANILAANIYKEDSDAVIIFGVRKEDQSEIPDYPCLFLNVSPARIVEQKKNTGSRCKVFLMKENDIGVNSRAAYLYTLPVDVYARTTNGQSNLSGNIHFFHCSDCCARQYWHSKPLRSNENTIVIIGFGNYGCSLLERAILMNILSDEQHVAYHIFGSPDEFFARHYRLGEIFSLNEVSKTRDSLVFHQEFWGAHHTLLEQASRIIICDDDEQKGWHIYWDLKRYYKINGRIDLRNNRRAPGVSYFGTYEEIFTPTQIMRTDLNHAAILINELFRKSVSYPSLSWEELDDLHQQSKISAADHLMTKVRLLLHDESIISFSRTTVERAFHCYRETKNMPELREKYRKLDHMRWLRFYIFYNWSYGPLRDDQARQHPMLCSYESLTDEQKKERDAAWELLGEISREMNTEN